MPVFGLSLFALAVSALLAGMFLQMERRTVLLSAAAAVVSGAAALWLLPDELSPAASPLIGLLLAALCAVVSGKHPGTDGVLYALTGGGCYALCHIFQRSLSQVCAPDVVFCIYCLFFFVHPLAVLLSISDFSLPPEKRAALCRFRGEGAGLSVAHLVLISAVLVAVLALAFPLLPGAGGGAAAAKIVAASALFWAGLSVVVLLVAYDQKREQSTAESGYHNDMETFMNVVRSQRHDYNLHVQTIAGLAAQNKWDECRSYVDALVQDTASLNAILPVKDPAVAALIGYYRALAAQRGVTLLVDIRDDMTHLCTNTYETNKIIGNLLQNAFDELEQQQSGEQSIELGIFKRGDACLIRVSNRVTDLETFSGRCEGVFRQGYTTKAGHDGVGLSSIRALARKVGGDVSAWLEGGTIHFIASIPLSGGGDAAASDSREE